MHREISGKNEGSQGIITFYSYEKKIKPLFGVRYREVARRGFVGGLPANGP